MEREIFWSAQENPGLEHLRLAERGEEITADGLVIGVEAEQPFRVHYKLLCDVGWCMRELRVTIPDFDQPGIDLLADGEGRWTTRGGVGMPNLEGCMDVDISATPFTNTLPIRRLALAPGESAEPMVVFVEIPDLSVRPERQRYTCLERRADGEGLYLFEALPSGFTAELSVDEGGLVKDYPSLFRRV